MTSLFLEKNTKPLLTLSDEEKIIEKFDCFLFENLPILGKLSLTNNFIHFYSNLIFFNRNIYIPFNEIEKINLNNVEIEIKLKNKIFLFISNEDIKNIYEKIISIYDLYISNTLKNKNELNKKLILSSENFENSIEELMSKKTLSLESSSLSDKISSDNELEDLDEEIKFIPIEEGVDFEICRKIIDINPKDLFIKYQTNLFPETSYEKYYEWVGDHSDIKISNWEEMENLDNSEIKKFKRTESFNLSLTGVPFIDHSEVSKTSIYYIDTNGTYYINGVSESKGIPFSDCFTIDTKIEFHPFYNNTKTVFRTYVRTNFLKSTFFKTMIISQTKKSYTEEVEKWLQFLQEKGEKIEGDYIYNENKIKKSSEDKSDNMNCLFDENKILDNKNEEEKNININKDKYNELKNMLKNINIF